MNETTCAIYDDVEVDEFPIDNPPKKPKWQIEREAYLASRKQARGAAKKKPTRTAAPPTRRAPPPTRRAPPPRPPISAAEAWKKKATTRTRLELAEQKSSMFSDQMQKQRRKKPVPEPMVLPAMEDALRGAQKLYGNTPGLRESLEEIPVVWCGRMNAVGKARFAIIGDLFVPYLIQLSSKVPISKKVAHDTLVHEFCHAIRRLVGSDRWEEPHGYQWKELMVASGQEPDELCEDEEYNATRQMAKMGAKTPAQKALAERYIKAGGASGIPRESLRLGETVYFMGQRSGKEGINMVKGKVKKRNPTKAVILEDGTPSTWRVPYAALSRRPF